MKYEIQIDQPQTYMERIHQAVSEGRYVLALGMMDDLEQWITRHVDSDSITAWRERIQRTERIVRDKISEAMTPADN